MPERTLNRTYSVGDQVPTCPVFTRAKIKSRFGILVDLPSQYIRGAFNKSPDFFFFFFLYRHLQLLLKIQYVIAIHLMRWLTNFYYFTFKSIATAAIGIYPTKTWLSQLVNFKNTIWTWRHFRRTICNKILF